MNNLLNNIIAHFVLKLKYFYLNDQKKIFVIDSVIVAKRYRNKGIGKFILEKSKNISQKKNFLDCN